MALAFAAPRAPTPCSPPRAAARRAGRARAHELAGAGACAGALAALQGRRDRVRRRAAGEDLKKLVHLGGTPAEKALSVNLDDKFYGSFAEIGAGQEVSRTFLQAGAAAGTVARSISAYDMKMSDVNYGKASRYVTQERLQQMLDTEYDLVDSNLRKTKGEDACFFAFASTVAAKAFMSNRECEGWIGLTYQSSPREERSTVILHIRMNQPTAQLQGEAIGILGTNLIYLCKGLTNPYLITSYLLDGMSISDEPGGGGRIEVDYVDFKGPAFPEVDARRVAFRLIQLRIANGVVLEPKEDGYQMVAPNSFLYKRPVIVERSRFKPVTSMHTEVIEAAGRKLKEELTPEDREPLKIMNLQIDDLTQPVSWQDTKARLERMQQIYKLDKNGDGLLSLEEFKKSGAPEEHVEQIFKDLSFGEELISIDAMMNITNGEDSVLVTDFINRMEMLSALKYPIILSNIKRTHQLVRFISRYTNQQIIIAVGGGGYSLERALFNPKDYTNGEGGMLKAFGNLFQSRKTRIFTYPAIDEVGNVDACKLPEGRQQKLYEYLESTGSILPLGNAYVGAEARDPATNKAFRFGSDSVLELIEKGSSDWEMYVPESIVEVCKSNKWFSRLQTGTQISPQSYEFLNSLGSKK